MDIVVFEHDREHGQEAFRRGEFDFVNGVSEVAETEFFGYIGAHRILGKMAEAHPTPREKEEVPLWVFVASNLGGQCLKELVAEETQHLFGIDPGDGMEAAVGAEAAVRCQTLQMVAIKKAQTSVLANFRTT